MTYKILVFLSVLFTSAVYADVAVIVHPSNGSSISKDDIKKIFLGKQSSFSDGAKATPYYLSSGDSAKETFDDQALGKSSSQLKAYWSKLVFTGKGTPPAELSGSADAISKVAGDAGAIAYVDSAAVNDSVKVVATFP